MFIWLDSTTSQVEKVKANGPVHICHIIVRAPRMAFGADSAE